MNQPMSAQIYAVILKVNVPLERLNISSFYLLLPAPNDPRLENAHCTAAARTQAQLLSFEERHLVQESVSILSRIFAPKSHSFVPFLLLSHNCFMGILVSALNERW